MIGKLTNEQIEEVLKENVLGRIGCCNGRKTYVVPVNYVFDGKFIIAHSLEGMKVQIMRNNPNVCFEVDEMKNFSNWRSVIAWGVYQELTDERDRYYAMKLFVDRMLYMKISRTAIPHDMPETGVQVRSARNFTSVIYRIVLNELTGRYEKDHSL